MADELASAPANAPRPVVQRPMGLMVLGASLSLLLLVIAFHGIHWKNLLQHLGSFTLISLVPAFACITGEFLARAARWQVLASLPPCRPAFHNVLSAVYLGYFYNNLLPGRVGELLRAWALSRREKDCSWAALIGTLVGERLLDAVFLLGMLGTAMLLGSALAPHGVSFPILAPLALALACACALGVVLALPLLEPLLLKWLDRFPRLASSRWRVRERAEQFLRGLESLRRVRSLPAVLLYSLMNWGLTLMTCWFLLLGFGLGTSWQAPFLVTLFVSMATMLPAAPGYVGHLQVAILLALGLLGVSREAALGFSVIYQVFGFVYMVGMGLLCLAEEGLLLRGREVPAP